MIIDFQKELDHFYSKYGKDTVDQIVYLFNRTNIRTDGLSEKFNINKSDIYRILGCADIAKRTKPPKPQVKKSKRQKIKTYLKSGKLTESQMKELISMYRKGFDLNEICEKFGIWRLTFYNIIRMYEVKLRRPRKTQTTAE